MVLFAENPIVTPEENLRIWLSNEAHSIRTFMSGVKLVLAVQQTVNVAVVPNGEVQFYILDDTKTLRKDEIRTSAEEFARIAPSLREPIILLARPLGGPAESALRSLGFKREIDGQVDGVWYPSREYIPASIPSHLPNGALLPQLGKSILDADCLYLVMVDYEWYPLSDAALHAYGPSSDLQRGKEYVFAPIGPSWPQAFDATIRPSTKPGDIERLYGKEAVARARHDYPAVRVALHSS